MDNDNNLRILVHQSAIKDTLCSKKSCQKSYTRDGFSVIETPIMDFNRLEKNRKFFVFSSHSIVVMQCRFCGGEKKYRHEGGTNFTLI